MTLLVMADLPEMDRARLAAEEQLRRDLARFAATKGCPEYLRASVAVWEQARAAVAR